MTTGNLDFLGDLPQDGVVADAMSELAELPIVRSGTGLEAGELMPSDYDADGVRSFQPMIPNEASFDPRLAFEVALGFDRPEDIYPRYDMSSDDWNILMVRPAFKATVIQYQDEIGKEGIGYRMKAKVQAESYLKDAHLLIKHPLTPHAVKADMIKWTTKMGGLEPAKSAEDVAVKFNLQINL